MLIFVSIGMTLGSLVAGILLQRKLLHHYTIMAVGAFSLAVGFLVTFPSDQIPVIYNNAPIFAFPGVFLAGFGAPLITISTLRALYDLQVPEFRVVFKKKTSLCFCRYDLLKHLQF